MCVKPGNTFTYPFRGVSRWIVIGSTGKGWRCRGRVNNKVVVDFDKDHLHRICHLQLLASKI